MRVLGHWALVSFFLLIFYGGEADEILGLLAGLIIFMLFTSDLMRAEQQKMLDAIIEANKAMDEAIAARAAAVKARAAGGAKEDNVEAVPAADVDV